ncbi:MAG: DUF72 domain-containing protein [Myxococcota bacterium]
MSVEIYAGCSGFSYKLWKGPFYPEKLPATKFLSFYGEHLSTVEINSTFYRMPKADMLRKWAGQVPSTFRFILKAPQRITHQKRLKDAAEDVATLLDAAQVLENRLGAVLFQLPPFLRKSMARLEEFLETLPSTVAGAMEFRHASWFDDEVMAALRHAGVSLAWVDWDETDKQGPHIVTGRVGYVRLRASDYSDEELRCWVERLRAQSWERVYVFFKHEDEGAAPRMAQRLMQLAAEN